MEDIRAVSVGHGAMVKEHEGALQHETGYWPMAPSTEAAGSAPIDPSQPTYGPVQAPARQPQTSLSRQAKTGNGKQRQNILQSMGEHQAKYGHES